MPLGVWLGITVVTEREDEVVCRVRVAPEHLNQAFVGHGGLLFALADTALGLLANPPGAGPVWVGTGFSLHLYRSTRVGDEIEARATFEHRGRRLTACRVEIRDVDQGRLLGALTTEMLPIPATAGTVSPDTDARRLDPADPLAVALVASARRHSTPSNDEPERGGGRTSISDTILGLFRQGAPVGVAVVRIGLDGTPAYLPHAWLVPAAADEQMRDALVESVLRAADTRACTELIISPHTDDALVAAFGRHGRLEDRGAEQKRGRRLVL